MQTQETPKRYHGLDLVRAIAMMLGLVIHVSIFFMDDQGYWMMGERFPDSFNKTVVEFIHLFRMQLFYLIAGFFAMLVIERKGFGTFMRDRGRRILMPFVFAAIFLVPLHDIVVSASGQPSLIRSLMQETSMFEAMKSVVLFGVLVDYYPREFVGFWHYWFLYFLILIYGIHVGLRILLPDSVKFFFYQMIGKWVRSPLAALYLGLFCFPIHYSLSSIGFPPNHLNFEYNNLGYYCVFYFFGVGLWRHRDAITLLEKRCFANLALGLCLVPFTMQLTPWADRINPSVIHDLLNYKVVGLHFNLEAALEGGWLKSSVVLLRACAAWLLCLGFIGLAERFVKKSNAMVRYLSDASYWIFYAHMLFTFSLSFLLTKVDWLNSLTKSYVLVVFSFYLMWWSYNTFVRYSFLGDIFMGRRKESADGKRVDLISTWALLIGQWRALLICFVFFHVLGTALKEQAILAGKDLLMEAQIAQRPDYFDDRDEVNRVRDRFGQTPLHLAASAPQGYRDYNPTARILAYFENPDVLDTMNRTPLFNAARAGNLEDVKLLLQAGANPNLADRYGHTPAHASAIKTHLKDPVAAARHAQIVDLLKEHGADLSILDNRGRSVEALRESL